MHSGKDSGLQGTEPSCSGFNAPPSSPAYCPTRTPDAHAKAVPSLQAQADTHPIDTCRRLSNCQSGEEPAPIITQEEKPAINIAARNNLHLFQHVLAFGHDLPDPGAQLPEAHFVALENPTNLACQPEKSSNHDLVIMTLTVLALVQAVCYDGIVVHVAAAIAFARYTDIMRQRRTPWWADALVIVLFVMVWWRL